MRVRVGECACDMLHARARFALVPSIVAHVARVCAFVSSRMFCVACLAEERRKNGKREERQVEHGF